MKMNKLVKYGLLAGFSAVVFVGQTFASPEATMVSINAKAAEAAALAAQDTTSTTRADAIKKAKQLADAAYQKLTSGEALSQEETAKLLDVLTQVEGSLVEAVADLSGPEEVPEAPVVPKRAAPVKPKVNVYSVPWDSDVVQEYYDDLVGEWSDDETLFGKPDGDDTGTAVTPG